MGPGAPGAARVDRVAVRTGESAGARLPGARKREGRPWTLNRDGRRADPRVALRPQVAPFAVAVEVSGFIVRELALPFQPREFEGFDLQGAEICVKDWKRGAVLMYERERALLFHYVLQVEGARAAEPTLSEAIPEGWPGRPGPSAVVWSSPGTELALVTDLPAGELLTLARSVGCGF